MVISKKLFLAGCVLSSCLNISAAYPENNIVVDEPQKTTELILVVAERDKASGTLQVTEATHCTPKNLADFVCAMHISDDEREDFAQRLLDALFPIEIGNE
jgi:hypothetical protein